MRVHALLLCLVFGLAGASPAAWAQTVRGAIRGVVTDATLAPVPNARIAVSSLDTNRVRSLVSDAQGEFAATSLSPGAYRVEAERDGFRKFSINVLLHLNQDLRLDVRLTPAALAQQIEVTTSRTALKTDSPSLGAVIDNQQVRGLPLDGRNWAELSLLIPGVTPAAQGSAGSVRGDFALNVNGGRDDANYFSLDGVYNGDPKLNGVGVIPPVDAIHEFEVLTNGYDASFGRNSAAQVNVATRSGGNAWHGSAYEFFRNAVLDARNFFAPAGDSDPAYRRNQFGFSLGGPLRKDRTFFFADYEGRIERQGITRITNVPTLAERSGDFTAYCPPNPPTPGKDCPRVAAFGGFVPVIPPGFQDPVGAAIVQLFPSPNRTPTAASPSNFVSSPTQRDNEHHFDLRVDHDFSSRDSAIARYSFSDRDYFEPFPISPGNAVVPGFGNSVPRRAQNLMLAETHTFRSNLLNEFRFSFSRVALAVTHEGAGTSLNHAVGLPDLSANPRDFGLSLITITGFSPLGNERVNPQRGISNTFQALDHLSWLRGRHTLKFGFDFRALQQNAFRDVESRGFLTFLGAVTRNPLADLLLGIPTVTGGAILDNRQALRAESWNFFVNDSWRIRPNLTLTAGLRYEYLSAPVDPEDRANLYDSATGSLLQVGTSGIPRAGYQSDRNNFGPRAGLAWTLGPKQSTVLRAGYGIYFDQSSLAPGEGLYFSQPYFDFHLAFLSDGLPPLSLSNPFPFATFALQTPASALAYQRDLRTPYIQHWSAGVQQRLGSARVLELAYAGSKGTRLLTARDINQPAPSQVVPNLRPNPLFGDITLVESRSNSTYHSLQARFQQSLDFGLSVLASYTWSKSLDDASSFFSSAGDPNFPQDSRNVRAERARSNFDVRQRLVFSYSYDIPIGKGHTRLADRGRLSELLSGWQTFGIWTFQTGRPFTVALLPDLDNSNTGRSILGFGANDRPNVSGNAQLSNPGPDLWFNTSAFAPPCRPGGPPVCTPFGSFGNSGRNILDGPGFASANVSLVKDTTLNERLTLQFRAEAFNVFNRPNFDLPDIFLGSPTFGKILSAQSPRHIQLGFKLLF